jgi:hypothetical protein
MIDLRKIATRNVRMDPLPTRHHTVLDRYELIVPSHLKWASCTPRAYVFNFWGHDSVPEAMPRGTIGYSELAYSYVVLMASPVLA